MFDYLMEGRRYLLCRSLLKDTDDTDDTDADIHILILKRRMFLRSSAAYVCPARVLKHQHVIGGRPSSHHLRHFLRQVCNRHILAREFQFHLSNHYFLGVDNIPEFLILREEVRFVCIEVLDPFFVGFGFTMCGK